MKDATQLHIRPAHPDEAGLFYTPHPEEDKRLGTVGHVRMDFGRSGNEFWHTWWPRGPEELNSPVFKLELQEVVDTLRESVLKNRFAITQLEPEIFKKVTGLDVKDFELLVSLNVFNEALMNDAVYKFKRYEDASLSYTGIDRHAGEGVGLYSTVVLRHWYQQTARDHQRRPMQIRPLGGQQASD